MWTILPASEFESARRSWDEVVARASASFLLSSDFALPLLAAFSSGKELLAVYEGSTGPEAATIVARIRPSAWSTFQPSEACLGLWVQAGGVDQETLVSALMRRLPGFPLVLALMHQDPRLSGRPAQTDRVRTQDYIQTASVPITGNFDEYWAARGKNLRNNMRKAHAQLERSGINSRLEIVTRPGDVAGAIADYSRLESTGWKGKAGTAVDPGNAQGRFYTELLERACERASGRIYRYIFNDCTVAMDLCVQDGESLVILKTAYDEQHAGLSPASLMREEQCRRLFQQGNVRRIEFYGPLMEWHTRWTDDVRTMYHVNYYRYGFLPRLHEALKHRRTASVKPSAN